jgi:hypothetical protein
MMSVAELQRTKGLWKSIMKRKQLGREPAVAARNVVLNLVDIMILSYAPPVRRR